MSTSFEIVVLACYIEEVNDSSFAVLGLLVELGPVSGYRLITVAGSRGMADWAGLSSTSVYKALRMLGVKRLATSKRNRKKFGKGPDGMLFAASTTGRTALRRHISEALLTAPEHSTQLRVGLACIGLISLDTAARNLAKRVDSVRHRIAAIEGVRTAQSNLPLGAAAIFEYVLGGLQSEAKIISRLAKLVEAQ